MGNKKIEPSIKDVVLDPVNVPNGWHNYLYINVLLAWETSFKATGKPPRVNPDAIKKDIGVSLVYKKTINEVVSDVSCTAHGDFKRSFVIFYSNEAALKDFLGLIRNCVAHGHYGNPRPGWIRFKHYHNNRLKLFGELKWTQFKKLVEFISRKSDRHNNAEERP